MPWKYFRWWDGLVTGLVLAIGVVALCLAAKQPLGACGAALFLVGSAVACGSVPLALGTRPPPGGVLTRLRRVRHSPPLERPAERPPGWWDRALTPDNVWLLAGLGLIALSFMPPFLGN